MLGQPAVPRHRAGKFVQLRYDNDKEEHIVLSPRALSEFHANIVERFFLGSDVKGTWNARRDSYALHHPEWDIVGGGHFEINDDTRRLRLYARSIAYGRFDAEGLAARMALVGVLSGYALLVE